MNRLFRLREYFKYLQSAQGIRLIHSPFLFRFFQQVLLDNRIFYCYHEIENIRDELRRSSANIEVKDLGAGAKAGTHSSHKRISSIAKKSASSRRIAQLLFRIANYFECRKILELGTSLGITTLYFSSVSNNAEVTTIEGDPRLAAISRKNFQILRRNNITLLEGSFTEKLPEALRQLSSVDLVYIDGDHRKIPTISYFNSMIPFIHNESVIIIGDIHWSEEMKQAWAEIITQSAVTLTIDLFYVGIIFFRKELSKQNFILRY